MKFTFNKLATLGAFFLFQSISYSVTSDYEKCYLGSLDYLTLRTNSTSNQFGKKILTQINGIGRSEYNNSDLDCSFTVTEDEVSKFIKLELVLTSNNKFVGGKTTHLSESSSNGLESYSLSCDYKKDGEKQNLKLKSEIKQKGGWNKTFKNSITIQKDETGNISKVKMDTDGPFNTAGVVTCDFKTK